MSRPPPPEGDNGNIVRPGISSCYLEAQDIARVNADEAAALLGYRTRDNSGGIWIPYDEPHKTGALVVNGRPFGRLRLDNPSLGAKYLSPRDSATQLYVPRNAGPFGKELVICEGEFKAIALCEAGVRAVAIGGICSAMSQDELIPGLAKLLSKWPPAVIYFLGDADTSLKFDFSREAVKLARALPAGIVLKLPRIPLDAGGNGIDDCRDALNSQFPAFWEKIAADAIEVSDKEDPSSLALRLLWREWDTITKQKDVYLPKLIDLGGNLISETALDELAKRVKASFDTNISAFKSDATKRKHDRASEAELSLPTTFYFDGRRYYRPNKDAFEQISREDAMLDLRAAGYWHRMATGCELSPCEVVLHRIQTEHRVDYAGPICGRPPGLWQEGTASVLCTRGPTIISATKGDASPIEQFLASLFGKGRDSFFEQQFITFAGWVLHARDAIRNHEQHLPGQVLGLIGPADCGKSLLQSVITQCLGGREADASLWLVRGNDFNSDLWGAEHLRLGDEELSEDHRRRHGLRERLKKLTTADVYPLHAKYCDSKSFRPIWRATLSANDDSDSISVLAMPTDSLADKIIYLRCYKPLNPYHDGSAKASKAFWQRLVESISAFLYKIENTEFPAGYRESRFFVKEFHHPDVVSLIASNSPVAPLGELIMRFLSERGGKIEGSVAGIYEELKAWNKENRGTSDYSSSAAHFGHQLYGLSELPGWKNCMSRSTRRVGGREKNQEQVVWSISVEVAPAQKPV